MADVNKILDEIKEKETKINYFPKSSWKRNSVLARQLR